MRHKMMSSWTNDIAAYFVLVIGFLFIATPFGFHIYHTVATNWAAMLILGLVVPPIGWLHGVGLMFGWW